MPPKRKNISKEFIDDSDDPEDTKVKTKKARLQATPAAASSANGSEEDMIPLSAKRFVSVSNFKGKMLVNIREYYEDKESGETRPGRKGISLSVDQWEALKKAVSTIDERLHK
ncbi:activated RNA polymerase II transcriptional coactivator p15-like [Halichondria panicea]|uniref:activated RNA polymerase II transcriptional coactivator p15-like n=1 Tax=Halichondria panicea TaxID=6063 RepID=UPI00312B78E7